MMNKELFEEFKHLQGQPVRIFTDDSRVIQGIVFCANECATRVLLENGDVALVDYDHIDTVEEPMMRLRRNFHQDVPVCFDGRCRKHCGVGFCLEDDDSCRCDKNDCDDYNGNDYRDNGNGCRGNGGRYEGGCDCRH